MNYTIFGESHGPAIGVVLTGVPSGLALDLDAVAAEMARRAPGQDATSTARKEADQVEILSGLFEGKTTGTPLCGIIRNTDTHSRDYSKLKDLPRPGRNTAPVFSLLENHMSAFLQTSHMAHLPLPLYVRYGTLSDFLNL